MKIGYVAEPYEESRASGMGYAVLGLLQHLLALKTEDTFIVYSSSPVSRDIVKGEFTNTIIPKGFIKRIVWFCRLKEPLDVCLFVAPFLPLLLPKRIKVVLVCKELGSQKIQVRGKETLFVFIRDHILMPLSLRRASLVVTPSQATKDDLIKFYDISADKIYVTYEGFQDLAAFPPETKTEVYDPAMRPYFFFTGKMKYRKNVHGIVSAFILLKQRVPSDCKLVLGGSAEGPYYEKIRDQLEKSGFAKDAYFIGYVSAGDQYFFYKNTIALMFPSFNEGFGMPILEAMSLGTPVITSNISSMAEIAGDAALLVNPYDPEDIGNAMEKAFTDETLRTDLIARGYKRASEFSWPKVAQDVMNVINLLR